MKPSLLSTCRLLIFLFCILMYSVVNAQTQKVSINAKNVTLQSLFSTIEKQTNLHFSYQTDIINSSRRVTLNLQNVSVASILMQVLPGFNLRHELVSGNSIVITRQDTSRKPLQTNPKKISGIVLDEHGEPIIGATIKQQGSKSGTITDVDGRFSLDAPEGCMLTISYIGYADKAVTAQSDMSISLSTNIEALDEVVVVGYGILPLTVKIWRVVVSVTYQICSPDTWQASLLRKRVVTPVKMMVLFMCVVSVLLVLLLIPWY